MIRRGGVFAYFTTEIADQKGNHTSYAHVGQHSGCSPDYAKECRAAEPHEYERLRNELEGLGYNLTIIKVKGLPVNSDVTEVEYHRNPTPAELRFGEGATHYKSFEIAECCNPGRILKRWIKDKDGLRYYRN